jgi:transposase
MEGWGYSTRELGEIAAVSHGTIANWLSDSSRAGLDEVGKVATVFGWTASELLDGEPRRDVMMRVAELEGFRARARRLSLEIAGASGQRGLESLDPGLFAKLPKRSAG